MRPLVLSLVMLVYCSGCLGMTARRIQNERMSSLIGHDIHEVITKWGAPSSVFDNKGTVLYTWIRGGGSDTTGAVIGGMLFASSSETCREWFEVGPDSRIVASHWRGDC